MKQRNERAIRKQSTNNGTDKDTAYLGYIYLHELDSRSRE